MGSVFVVCVSLQYLIDVDTSAQKGLCHCLSSRDTCLQLTRTRNSFLPTNVCRFQPFSSLFFRNSGFVAQNSMRSANLVEIRSRQCDTKRCQCFGSQPTTSLSKFYSVLASGVNSAGTGYYSHQFMMCLVPRNRDPVGGGEEGGGGIIIYIRTHHRI